MEFLASSLLELITQTSTNLPPDVRAAMSLAAGSETPGTQSSQALNIILSNIDMANDDQGPICQDTGMPTFVVTGVGFQPGADMDNIRHLFDAASRGYAKVVFLWCDEAHGGTGNVNGGDFYNGFVGRINLTGDTTLTLVSGGYLNPTNVFTNTQP